MPRSPQKRLQKFGHVTVESDERCSLIIHAVRHVASDTIIAIHVNMTEDELIERLRERSQDPRRATSAGGSPSNYSMYAPTFPPVPLAFVQDAQQRFGFPLPTLLIRIWAEVANGGVGPGYGIHSLEGGLTDDGLHLPLPDFFLEYRNEPDWIELIGEKSALRAFLICDWGCGTFSVLDCSVPEGNMLLLDKGQLLDQRVTFARWIEDWLNGIQVGANDYRSATN